MQNVHYQYIIWTHFVLLKWLVFQSHIFEIIHESLQKQNSLIQNDTRKNGLF